MGWTKGRKQSLQEEIAEVLDENKIDHDPMLLFSALNKLSEKELEQLRYIFLDLDRKVTK